MTIEEVITAAKTKGPWCDRGVRGWIRTVSEPELCPIAAVGGGNSDEALTTATEKLGMTKDDAIKLVFAADGTASFEPGVQKIRERLEQELLGLPS